MRRACLLVLLLPLLTGCLMMDEMSHEDPNAFWYQPAGSMSSGYDPAIGRCGTPGRAVSMQTREPELAPSR